MKDLLFPQTRFPVGNLLSVVSLFPGIPHLPHINPDLLRPRITLPEGLFPELPAKNGTFLPIFSKIARFARFTPNGAFYAAV